ncbi:unnamed protein product [Rotaria magnacalcarata]|uniref:F-box domain-containing protein n=1 Tax=Rotaria magnacalcarata TaxID=392030 RepID=A0A819XUY6_9BILA|nr:unnamed protein product [Rotaria magnacalcarata]CAF2111734.1 unnamed protein product [Rotaria magnacalcarata]CAF4146572.1 unnamed protein product [Rotaria magnacalcarata]CAF4185778.1 unnamed protein product [Rotaria magnacalcarata]
MLPSKFEKLPDEIILEICLYLRPFEIINEFGQLNTRLNRTISQFRRNADIHHLTLDQYQRWYWHLLPDTAEYIISLVLSNWNSPGQIYRFNKSTENYTSLCNLLPNLKQLRLIDFSNEDIDILPKLAMIDKISIDIDGLKPLLQTTKHLLDYYLFCACFSFKEIRLWVGEGGIRLQHSAKLRVNPCLEQLTIVVANVDDLILLFKRAPNLIKLYVEISTFSSSKSYEYVTYAAMPKKLTDFHVQTNNQKALTFEGLFIIMIHIPTIKRLSLDIETYDIDYGDGLCWVLLISRLPNLKSLYFRIRIWIGTGIKSIDINPFIESFERANLPVVCYADKRVIYIDTIPYDMHEFKTNMCVTTSPTVKYAKTTDEELYQRRAHGVQSLLLCARHEQTPIDNWLYVLNRFPYIRALDLMAVNIIDQTNLNEQLRLPRLIALRYVRSTRCEINIPFFLLLVTNNNVTPILRALTVMYGDIIHLCKRLSNFTSHRLQELWLFGSDTDGRIIVKDIDLLLSAFPNLHHLSFVMQSSRCLNRNLENIIEMILLTLPNLISFRLICRRGSLQLPILSDNDKRKTWIRRVCGLNDNEEICWVINKKEISIWK